MFEKGQHSWARPYPGTGGLERLARQPAGKYYLFENSKQARRLYPYAELKTDFGKIITGLSFSRNLEVCRCLLSGGGDGSSARVCLHEEYVGNSYLIRIESKTELHGDDSADAVLVDIDRHIAGTSVLEAFDARFHETDIQLDRLMPRDHWIITILENVSCGTADMSQPIQLGNAPWHTDPRTKRKYDPETKRELTGRQFLPLVYRLDGALLITDTSHVRKLESEIDFNDTEGFALPDPISKKITTEIDFLRFLS